MNGREQPSPDVEVLERMMGDELAGAKVTIEVGPFTAMLLVTAVQYTLRHDAMPGGPDVAMAAFGSLLNQLDPLLSRYPGAMEIVESQNPPAA